MSFSWGKSIQPDITAPITKKKPNSNSLIIYFHSSRADGANLHVKSIAIARKTNVPTNTFLSRSCLFYYYILHSGGTKNTKRKENKPIVLSKK